MSTRPLHVILMGAIVILLTIAPVPTCAEFEKTNWDVQELFKQCNYKGSLDKVFCLEFVSVIARQVFKNGLALKHSKVPPDLTTTSIPSACPKSIVSNEAMVEAFNEWANEHLEEWRTSAPKGVMHAISDAWPCFDENPRCVACDGMSVCCIQGREPMIFRRLSPHLKD